MRPILTYILVALTSLSGLSKNHESRRQILGKGMWEEIVEERDSRYDSSLYIMKWSKLKEIYNETGRSTL